MRDCSRTRCYSSSPLQTPQASAPSPFTPKTIWLELSYERFDFERSPTDSYHLLLLMKDVRALLAVSNGCVYVESHASVTRI